MARKAAKTETNHIAISGSSYTYAITRTRRRSLCVMFDGVKGFRVLAPFRATSPAIQHFLNRHHDWLAKRLVEGAALQEKIKSEYAHGAHVPYLGEKLELVLSEGKAGCTQVENRLHITGANLNPDDIRLDLTRFYKQRAREIIKTRLDEWAHAMGVTYKTLRFSSARRRWGSCSHDNEIRINWRIIMAAPELIDYLLVHELAHIRHKNHGPRFWRCVEEALPESRMLRAQLRAVEGEYLNRLR